MADPRISVLIVVVGLLAFIAVGVKIYGRAMTRSRVQQEQHARMVFLKNVIGRQISINGLGRGPILFPGVELEVRWIESPNRVSGTRLVIKGAGCNLHGLACMIHLKAGVDINKSFMGNMLKIDYIRPDQIDWIEFSIPANTQVRTRRRQR